MDVVQWVNEGRVDGGVIIEGPFQKQVLDESGPYYNLKDEVVYNEFAVIKTWPLFNKKNKTLQMRMTKLLNSCKKKRKQMNLVKSSTVETF